MKNITKRSIIIGILLVIGLSFLIKRIIKANDMNEKSSKSSQYLYNQKFDKEDSILFKTNELKTLKFAFEISSSYRNAIKCFEYGDIGKLHYTKIDLINDISLNNLIKYRDKNTRETTMHTYHNLNGNNFDFSIRGEKTEKVDSIIFSLKGDESKLKKNVYNKNFVSYYLPVSTLSLRYGEDAPTDIFFGGKEGLLAIRNKYPLMISFYKKQKSLYVMILIPNKDNVNLEPNLFEKLMNDNADLGNNEIMN